MKFTTSTLSLALLAWSTTSGSADADIVENGGYYLRRRAAATQQQCEPVQQDDYYRDLCVDSLFVLLELEEKYDTHKGNVYSAIEKAFMDSYNSVTACAQNGADRSINSVTALDSAQLQQYKEDNYPQINGTALVFEIDMSCNSCGEGAWQIFEGTEIGYDYKPTPPDADNRNICNCEGPEQVDFVDALQDTINKLNEHYDQDLTVRNATQIPLLYPGYDDEYCNNPYKYTTFGYYGLCPGSEDKEFSCMFTHAPTYSPTESPTSSPTWSPTKTPQPGDCTHGYEDKVYIHKGCNGGAGFAEDKDCPNGKCDWGPAYYCNDDQSVTNYNWPDDFDTAYICKDCASRSAYYDTNTGAWYCQM